MVFGGNYILRYFLLVFFPIGHDISVVMVYYLLHVNHKPGYQCWCCSCDSRMNDNIVRIVYIPWRHQNCLSDDFAHGTPSLKSVVVILSARKSYYGGVLGGKY